MKSLVEGTRRTVVFVVALVSFPAGLFAGNVVGLSSFTNGSVADATAVNANFGAVAAAVCTVTADAGSAPPSRSVASGPSPAPRWPRRPPAPRERRPAPGPPTA